MIQQLIDRYKRLRTERFLAQTYQYSYAFVGMGQHSLTNLYPVLHYLSVPLKYICVTSERKVQLIERKFPHVKATTSLDMILNDDAVKGVFVSASPSAHFSIASQILKSGKSLFIEKPPCQTLRELDALIDQQRLYGSPVTLVGLQKRYAPAVQILRKRLDKEHLISYDLHYLTGNYPEGNALLDLYIHPLDFVCHLFGKPEILVCQQVASASYILMLRHPHIVGTLELSTSYTWTSAGGSLKVCTSKGIYRLSQMELLTFEPKHSSILGIPYEKVHKHNKTIEYLYARNNFTPIFPNNQIYSQGYYSEIQSFITSIEHGHSSILTDIASIKPTYEVLTRIKRLFAESN
ncbi:MAG: Gfo/Idh/MocA family oxidoreductase [Bacteroidaceae bacterium]|nr:Gfo/Idh/MocA family oxidoreductase [Bacteroidaceae bacterium]